MKAQGYCKGLELNGEPHPPNPKSSELFYSIDET